MPDLSVVLDYVDPLTITYAKYLALSIALGFLIGAEREHRHKDAGISTHIFVMSGAMLFTLMSLVVGDSEPTRIAAQIVSGIGFLGAGLILKDGVTVRNLTTAASIWFAGAMGMAIGFGYWQIAVVAAIASFFIPRIPHLQREATEVLDSIPESLADRPKPKPRPSRKKTVRRKQKTTA